MNRAEAEKKGIKIQDDWRNAEIGDHIVTTDDVVLEITDKSEMNRGRQRKSTTYLHTKIGIIPTTISAIYAKRIPKNIYGDTNVKRGHLQLVFVEDLLKNGRLTPTGDFTVDSKIESYQSVFQDNNDNTALLRANRILKKDWVQEQMAGTLKEEFGKLNVDQKWLAEQYLALVDKKIPAVVRKQTLDKIEKIMEFDADDTTKDQGYQISEADRKLFGPIRKIISLARAAVIEGKDITDAEFSDVIMEEVKQLLPKDITSKEKKTK